MNLSFGRRIVGLILMLGLSSAVLGAAPTWTFVDAYQADWPVAVACSAGSNGKIDATTPTVRCAVPANGSVTFSVSGALACTANFDQNSDYLEATSTCKPAASAANTLTFAADRGVIPSVLWTFNDGYSADLVAGVAVACPSGVGATLSTATPSVACLIPANGTVTFTLGGVLACTANFDADSQYAPATSTCQPASFTADTLVFPANQGVVLPHPAANVLAIGFPGAGLMVSCVSGACGTTNSQQVVMAHAMRDNGAMTLGFSTGTGSSQVTCNVGFVNNFVDNRNTTCQGISLVSGGVPGADQELTFPTQTVGSNTLGQLSVYPAAPASAATGTSVGNRTITFVNQCAASVWFSLVSGTVGPQPGGGGEHGGGKASGNLCAGDSDGSNVTCPYGSSCRYVDSTQAYCFYNTADPAPAASGNLLDQFMLAGLSQDGTAASSAVTIPIYQENNVVFSGGASARLGCQDAAGNYVHCAVGNCNGDNNALGCGYTSGTGNGATIAEFTLQAKAIDYYDLSIINGAHVPMKMAPSSGQTPDATQRASVVGYYWCGEPGATTATSGQPACDWNLATHLAASTGIPAANAKYFVSVTAPAIVGPVDVSKLDYCSADSDCSAPSVCGLSLGLLAQVPEESRASLFSATGANGKAGPYTCGSKLGYNTPVNICSLVSVGDDGFLHCNSALSLTSPAGGNVSLTNANLYACNGNTDNCIKGKSDYSGTVCCGCSTWSGLNAGIVSGEGNACAFADSKPVAANTNTAWDGTGTGPDVQGKITFLKQACPSAYAYQFDDATSTFNCYVGGASKSTAAGYNVTDYTITFCPSGTELQ